MDKFEYDKELVNGGNVTGYVTFTTSNHHDAACAVCMVEGRGSIMVMPGTDKCLDSWTTEYNGYLINDWLHMCRHRDGRYWCIERP